MKHKIMSAVLAGCMIVGSFALTGCRNKSAEAPTEPKYYLSEDELPNDAYYIVRNVSYKEKSLTGSEKKVKETRYYPLLQAENTAAELSDSPKGYDPKRVTWVNNAVDEAQIPTMYANDKMIYKSETKIPEKYTLEKYFDNGYTIGVMGLAQDLSGNYRYYGKDDSANPCATMSTSDAVGFDALEGVESIYLAQVGKKRVTPLNVSLSGTVTGLKKNKVYKCDIRRGTEKIDASLTANVHYFSSAETYIFGSFTFVTPVIAQINIPEYATTGYYNLGGGGFYRYVADEDVKDWTKLKAKDFNDTIYTYDEDGNVDGTSEGLIFDENNFLVPGSKEKDSSRKSGLKYNEFMDLSEKKSTITNPTEMEPEDGVYSGIYECTSVSSSTGNGKKLTYKVQMTNVDNNENLDMKYIKGASGIDITNGVKYSITFKEAGSGFDGYKIETISEWNGSSEDSNDSNSDAEIENNDSGNSTNAEDDVW